MKEKLYDILNEEWNDCKPLILRGNDIDSIKTSDIDLIISKPSFKRFFYKFVKRIELEGWQIISYRELVYMRSIVVFDSKAHNHPTLKIDFFIGIGWYGVTYPKIETSFFKNIKDIEKQKATITFIHKMTYSGKLNTKDVRRIREYTPQLFKKFKLLDYEHEIISGKTISKYNKWLIRFKSSGYPYLLFPVWCFFILLRLGNQILLNHSSLKIYVNLQDQSQIESLLKELIKLYQSSGDSLLPSIKTKRTTYKNNFFTSSNYNQPTNNERQLIIILARLRSKMKPFIFHEMINIRISSDYNRSQLEYVINNIDNSIKNRIL